MIGYRKVKTSRIGNHPYCPNCQHYLVIYGIPASGYKSRTETHECLVNTDSSFDKYWYMNGAGCPLFSKAEGYQEANKS